MYLYFEKHWDFNGSVNFLYKNFSISDKCYQLFNWQGYSTTPDDSGSTSIINQVWVDINKYYTFGNDVLNINEIIKPYIRLMKIKKLKN